MLGRPLLAWSIHHAQKLKYSNRIIVSTDDEEIAVVAQTWGAEVPFLRPAEFAHDLAPDIDVFRHALNWLHTNENYVPDLILHLRPTGPARRVSIIDAAIEKILSYPDADSLRSVSLAMQTPFKMWFLQDDSTMTPVISHDNISESHSVARQMLPKAYWQNGYVDITKPRTILEKHSMVGDRPLSFLIDERVADVDYLDDIPKVESALKAILEGADERDMLSVHRNRFPV
jgi:N-acylneuraminate cytidylyltransferase